VPLGDWLPEFDVRERHERFVAAPPERALQLALASSPTPDWIVVTLFRLRRIPHVSTVAQLAAAIGLEECERTPTTWVALGGKDPRIGIDFVARPEGPGCLLTTETRVHATTARARRRFRLYWLVVGPFSALVRRRWLRAIARAAP
jgi:hypothetical protein